MKISINLMNSKNRKNEKEEEEKTLLKEEFFFLKTEKKLTYLVQIWLR